MILRKEKITKYTKTFICSCGKEHTIEWQDIERIYTEVERVYATRYDCMPVLG